MHLPFVRLLVSLAVIVALRDGPAFAGAPSSLPSVQIKTLAGQAVDIRTAVGGKPTLIVFWATSNASSIKALTAVADHADDWLKHNGVQVLAVSLDDPRTAPKVGPTVEAKGWTFPVFVDSNLDLRNAFELSSPPAFVLVGAKGAIEDVRAGYAAGDEHQLDEEVQKLKP